MAPKVREVIWRLEQEGWILVKQRDSHRQFKHPDRRYPDTRTTNSRRAHGRVFSGKRAGDRHAHADLRRGDRMGAAQLLAYVPDLPGCVSTGKTVAETTRHIQEAITGHLAVMHEYGEPIPEPRAQVTRVSVRLTGGEDERN